MKVTGFFKESALFSTQIEMRDPEAVSTTGFLKQLM
jgi:hypothetical protein